MMPSVVYDNRQSVSHNDFNSSRCSYPPVELFEELVFLVGDRGGVNMPRSPAPANVFLIGISGDAGELIVLADIEGRLDPKSSGLD